MRSTTHSSSPPALLMVGPFPPPVHGQAMATLATAEMLEDAGFAVTRCDTGEGNGGGRAKRLGRLAKAFSRIAGASEDHIYISANANRGMGLTWLMCRLARSRGKRLTIHHHAYSYIGSPSNLAARMAGAAGPGAMHLTQCRSMGEELSARYPVIGHTLPFSNVGFVDEAEEMPRPARALTLGHMSNLTEDKGLGLVIETMRRAIAAGTDARLIVAGPCSDEFARDTVASASAELGARFEYRGPVYGEDKEDFFRAIDLFLFPTRYRNETQGIVNLEALSYGVPVAAFGQCCVGETVGDKGGLVVAASDDFAQQAQALIAAFEANPARHRASAREQFRNLSATHASDLDAILAHFKSVAQNSTAATEHTND